MLDTVSFLNAYSDTWENTPLCAQTDPEIWFPTEESKTTSLALRICNHCPALSECFQRCRQKETPMNPSHIFGIEAGLTKTYRRARQKPVWIQHLIDIWAWEIDNKKMHPSRGSTNTKPLSSAQVAARKRKLVEHKQKLVQALANAERAKETQHRKLEEQGFRRIMKELDECSLS